MAKRIYSSPEISREMERIYGSDTKVVKIGMRHRQAVKTYVMKIEEAHKKAAKSKLRFPR